MNVLSTGHLENEIIPKGYCNDGYMTLQDVSKANGKRKVKSLQFRHCEFCYLSTYVELEIHQSQKSYISHKVVAACDQG